MLSKTIVNNRNFQLAMGDLFHSIPSLSLPREKCLNSGIREETSIGTSQPAAVTASDRA